MASRATISRPLRDCVRNFTPSWFAVNMGTGAISILLLNFPYSEDSLVLRILTYVIFFLNVVLFLLFNAFTVWRYVMFPDVWSIMIRHPTQSLFVGTYPMGAATLLNVAIGLIYGESNFGGKSFLYTIWALWWANVAISLTSTFGLVHIMKSRQNRSLSRMSAIWLLPVVTVIVASSTGGVIAGPLATFKSSHALLTLTVSFVLVSIGLGLAFMILTAYLLSLLVHGLPSGAAIFSVFIPLGPMGQGGFSILLLAQGFKSVLPEVYDGTHILGQTTTGDIMSILGLSVALVLWSLATMWLLYAVLAVFDVLCRTRFPFKISFWGLIFPNGVYANLTIQLYHAVDSHPFRVWGTVWTGVTMLAWAIVFTKTLILVRGGAIFESPCLEEYDMSRAMELREGGSGDTHNSADSGNGSGTVRRLGGCTAASGPTSQ